MNALKSLPPKMRDGLAACAAVARRSASPHAMLNIGTVLLTAGDTIGAENWFREAIALSPGLPEAHQNLAALLQDSGRVDEAQEHRDQAFRNAPLRIETAPDEQCRVLVLSSAGYGNVPIDDLLPRATTTRLKFFVSYATDADWAGLPAYDVVFNAVGDADMLPPGSWDQHLDPRRVLNPPACVAQTRRDRLPARLAGLADIVVPRVVRHFGDTPVPLRFPLILRPVGSHGGKAVTLIHRAADIPQTLSYLTEFHDYRNADGQFRKYRMIFVGGEPFPCHLAISSKWLVHYFSADMKSDADKCQEERAFLDDPEGVIGKSAMAAIRAIGRRLALDYAGVDFSILPDGRVLVFEANATMVAHVDDAPARFNDKQQAVAKIFAAFHALLPARLPACAATSCSVNTV